MTNLLPPEEKAKLLLEKNKKLIIIFGIIIIIPLCCLILILLSINFYVLGEVGSQKVVLEQAQKVYQTPDFLTFKDLMQKNNKVLSQLDAFYSKEIYLSQVLKTIALVSRPQNLYLADVDLKRNTNQKIGVTVSGFSDSRDDLLLFQKNLKESPAIENVSFAPESWVAPQDVTFNLTFDIKP